MRMLPVVFVLLSLLVGDSADSETLKSACRRYVSAQLSLAHRACQADPSERVRCAAGLRPLGRQARRDCRWPPPATLMPPVTGLSIEAAASRLRLRGIGVTLTLSDVHTPKAVVQDQIPSPGAMLDPGGASVLAISTPLSRDFLTFFGGVQTTLADAAGYYDRIDPDRRKATLADWLAANRWGIDMPGSREVTAVYGNELDLGFGRRMHLREDVYGVSYYVENFADAEAALAQDGLLATVAMEFSARTGERFAAFYAFGPDGARIDAIDLDGRGEKPIPEMCLTCHGGRWRTDTADLGAGFIPFIPEAFSYAGAAPRETQMAAFRVLNAAILRTDPPSPLRTLIEGWYATGSYDRHFVPAGWNHAPADRRLYGDVYVPACRSCHLLREARIDFDTAQELRLHGPIVRRLLASGDMPRARPTWESFWLSTSPHRVNALLKELP